MTSPRSPGDTKGHLQGVQGHPRIPTAEVGQVRQDRLVHLEAESPQTPLPVRQRRAAGPREVHRRERLEAEDLKRESRAEFTSNYGFSVVAPMSTMMPSSTAGSRASCWALLKRWISSMKRMVRVEYMALRSAASPRILRTSATPLVTALICWKCARVRLATMRARVVFPDPEGPRRWRSAACPTRWRCAGRFPRPPALPGRRTPRGYGGACAPPAARPVLSPLPSGCSNKSNGYLFPGCSQIYHQGPGIPTIIKYSGRRQIVMADSRLLSFDNGGVIT